MNALMTTERPTMVHTTGRNDHVLMLRVSKRKAVRLLYGVLHNDAMSPAAAP